MTENPHGRQDYYKILNLEKTCSLTDVKKSYRTLAKEHHPDKGGDPEEFKKIQKAYETLSDTEKRQHYDQFGEDLDQNRRGMDGGMGDILSQMFGGMFGGMGGGMGGMRNSPITNQHIYNLSMQEMHFGGEIKFQMEVDRVCEKCHGKGGEGYENCRKCRGKGSVIKQINQGFMTIQQQIPCPECDGKGGIVPKDQECAECHGEAMVKTMEEFECVIPPGLRDGAKTKIDGKGSQYRINGNLDFGYGSILIIFQQKVGEIYEIDDDDNLVYKAEINLLEALCGTEVKIPLLSGDTHILDYHQKVITPETTAVIENEGLRRHKQSERGDLIVKFKVIFPKNVMKSEDLGSLPFEF